ncbi:hypothetical protein Tco_0732952 [Tanacetum coccineum]
MNPQEKQQVAACDDKWVPFSERDKISSTNIRLETTVPQKEDTFQVVIDLIKNSTYFKAFTVSADVPKIFMQQFWYSIKKLQGTYSYEFLLANKKCTVNAEVFRTVLDICPRVEGVDFTDVLDDDTALTFLIDLGYKGPLYKHTNMFVDHMHHPWRTLATLINKCLSGKTESNDKLRKSRINILWGMFKRENVDYPELIWEEIAYQIDHGKEKRSRRENMPYPQFTKIIINHFLKQHKSLTNLNFQHCHTIKDDGIVSRLKFVRIGEDYQEYGLPIPETMLTEVIKQSESYQMFIKYSTGQILPKKRRGKDDPDDEAEEADEARQVHATHARIMTESVPESTKKSGGRSSKSVVIQDTPSAPKSKPTTSKTKLKGAPSLTLEEQEVADIMQALKESKKTSKRQPGTEGSNEGTGSKPGVPNESTVVSATSSEGTSIKLRVLDEENDITEEKKDDKDGDVDDEGDDHIIDTQDADNEDVETESDEDDIYKNKILCDEESLMQQKQILKEFKVKGFGDQFLKLSSDSSLVSTIMDTIDTKINSLLEVKIQSEVPHTQSSFVLSVPVFVISKKTTTVPTLVIRNLFNSLQQNKHIGQPSSPSLLPSFVSHLSFLLSTLSLVPSIIDNYLGSKVGDSFQKKLKKHTVDLIQKYFLHQVPESFKKQTPTVDLEQGSKKSALKIPKKSKKEEQAGEKQKTLKLLSGLPDQGITRKNPPAGPNQCKKTKKRQTKESESSKKPSSTKETPRGKDLSKGSKTGKSASAKEPVEEPIVEVVMDDADKLDWNNLEGDRYPFDLSKPLPLQGPSGHRTIAADYFFNNDLEYLKTSDP